MVSCELFGNVGALHAQVQITVSIGEPNVEKKKLAALTREAYENGVKILRPGITFGQLVDAMSEPNRREGAWDLSPLVHSMNPHEAVSSITVGISGPNGFPGVNERLGKGRLQQRDIQRPDLVIQEGMTFEFEPNSCYGQTYVDIGGSVLVTKNGCEELNKIPTRMVVVPD